MMMMMMMPSSLTTSTIGGEKKWFKWGNRDLNKIHSNLLFRLTSAWQRSNSKGKKQIRSWVNFNVIMFTPKEKHNTTKKKLRPNHFLRAGFLFAHKKKRKDLLLTTFINLASNHLTSPSDDFIHPYVSHLHCQIQSPLDLEKLQRDESLFFSDG